MFYRKMLLALNINIKKSIKYVHLNKLKRLIKSSNTRKEDIKKMENEIKELLQIVREQNKIINRIENKVDVLTTSVNNIANYVNYVDDEDQINLVKFN